MAVGCFAQESTVLPQALDVGLDQASSNSSAISELAASIESGSVNWPRATPRRRGRSGAFRPVSRATGLPLRAITTSVSAPVSIAFTRCERWAGEIASPIASPSPLV